MVRGSAVQGAAECAECGPRRVAPDYGSITCRDCDENQVLVSARQECRDCPLYATPVNGTVCNCTRGRFLSEEGACVSCPEGGDCSTPGTTAATLVSLPG